ncbi:hypothetical protein OBBRIDRAFT_804335 [Obba rivulosa]|uniref:Uncharacterized protein n=1 Tax=Obba rivulosa TaxID=1052685 RepID=A0A8E2AS12_9APHY|nr:hypothetical protein OBBRIDRAFT_804335 [Obba rivulosa]
MSHNLASLLHDAKTALATNSSVQVRTPQSRSDSYIDSRRSSSPSDPGSCLSELLQTSENTGEVEPYLHSTANDPNVHAREWDGSVDAMTFIRTRRRAVLSCEECKKRKTQEAALRPQGVCREELDRLHARLDVLESILSSWTAGHPNIAHPSGNTVLVDPAVTTANTSTVIITPYNNYSVAAGHQLISSAPQGNGDASGYVYCLFRSFKKKAESVKRSRKFAYLSAMSKPNPKFGFREGKKTVRHPLAELSHQSRILLLLAFYTRFNLAPFTSLFRFLTSLFHSSPMGKQNNRDEAKEAKDTDPDSRQTWNNRPERTTCILQHLSTVAIDRHVICGGQSVAVAKELNVSTNTTLKSKALSYRDIAISVFTHPNKLETIRNHCLRYPEYWGKKVNNHVVVPTPG